VENYDSHGDTGTVTERTVRQVPWCLTSYDSRGPKVIMDQEAVRQTLNAPLAVPIAEQSRQAQLQASSILNGIAAVPRHDSGHLRRAGIQKAPKSWLDTLFLRPEKTFVSHILPVLTKCCLIGSITLNTDGEYLLTAHPKYGFFLFNEISFVSVASACRASSLFLEKVARRCGQLRSGFMGGFVLSLGLFAFSKCRPGALSRAMGRLLRRSASGPAASAAAAAAASSGGAASVGAASGGGSAGGVAGSGEVSGSNTNANMNMCVICLSEPRTVLVRPCRHLCLCHSCFLLNYPTTATIDNDTAVARECPICRDLIESFEVIYNP
jgi:hypothetical protein